MDEHLIKLLAYLNAYENERTPSYPNIITSAIVHINEHIAQPITIDEICKAINISKYYFCHGFKKAVGMSVMKYILATRISRAEELLHIEDMAVGEVAEACGFRSMSDFCHAFKTYTGLTALEYRQKTRK